MKKIYKTTSLYILHFAFCILNCFSQISFKIQIDSLTNNCPEGMKIINCVDGGIALAGTTESNWIMCGFMIKTDSNGTIEWSKLYPSYWPGAGGFRTANILSTSDSGFYFEMEALDPQFMVESITEIMKIDKYGAVQASKMVGSSMGGTLLYFKEIEKNTNNLFVIGYDYDIDQTFWEPCCFTSFFAKLDTSLSLQWAKELNINSSMTSARIIYSGNNPAGFLIGGRAVRTMTSNGPIYEPSLIRLDTAGNVLWQKYYIENNTVLPGRLITNILQVDSSFFLIEKRAQQNTSAAIRKIDYDGNTIFYKILNNVNPPDPGWYIDADEQAASCQKDTNHILISIGRAINNYNSLLIEMDLVGNITQAQMEISNPHYDSDIDPVGKNGLFLLSSSGIIQFEKEHISNMSCDYIPFTISAANGTIFDSTAFPLSNPSSKFITINPIIPITFTPPTQVICTSVTGLPDLNNKTNNSLIIYPNPAKEYLAISHSFSAGDKIQLNEISGRILFTKTFSSPTLNFKLETLNYSPGVYLFNLMNEKTGERWNGKIVISD